MKPRFFIPAFGLWLLNSGPAAETPLDLVNITLHQFEDGPTLPSSQEFFAGEIAFVSFQVSGLRKNNADRVRLRWRIDAVDPAGIPLAPAVEKSVDTELAPEDKKWMPKVRSDVVVPATAPTGNYRFRVELRDEIGSTQTRREISFRVRGRAVEPAETLVLRNFRFYRSDDDVEPVRTPSFRPGDSVWGKFEIVGFKLGENNRIDVEYGVKVTSAADGKVFFDAPEAASDNDRPFYPRRFVTGTLSLVLGKDMTPGEFIITVTTRDRIGSQTAGSQHTFRIE